MKNRAHPGRGQAGGPEYKCISNGQGWDGQGTHKIETCMEPDQMDLHHCHVSQSGVSIKRVKYIFCTRFEFLITNLLLNNIFHE